MTATALVREYLERVGGDVLEDAHYRSILGAMIRGRAGVYALAGKAVVGRAVNGWHFWRFRRDGEWVRLRELRKSCVMPSAALRRKARGQPQIGHDSPPIWVRKTRTWTSVRTLTNLDRLYGAGVLHAAPPAADEFAGLLRSGLARLHDASNLALAL